MKSDHIAIDRVVFDLETTGLSPRHGARVIEIGAVRLHRGKAVDEFQSMIDAGVDIPSAAQAVHGINRAMLKGQPGPADVFPHFMAFVGQAGLVAHNAQFDISFLREELSHLGMRLRNCSDCTLKLSRQMLRLPNYRLDTVYQALGGEELSSYQRHRALDDARMAAFVWQRLNE